MCYCFIATSLLRLLAFNSFHLAPCVVESSEAPMKLGDFPYLGGSFMASCLHGFHFPPVFTSALAEFLASMLAFIISFPKRLNWHLQL